MNCHDCLHGRKRQFTVVGEGQGKYLVIVIERFLRLVGIFVQLGTHEGPLNHLPGRHLLEYRRRQHFLVSDLRLLLAFDCRLHRIPLLGTELAPHLVQLMLGLVELAQLRFDRFRGRRLQQGTDLTVSPEVAEGVDMVVTRLGRETAGDPSHVGVTVGNLGELGGCFLVVALAVGGPGIPHDVVGIVESNGLDLRIPIVSGPAASLGHREQDTFLGGILDEAALPPVIGHQDHSLEFRLLSLGLLGLHRESHPAQPRQQGSYHEVSFHLFHHLVIVSVQFNRFGSSIISCPVSWPAG